ncbi:unnamed protein product [Adineta steineri]|uniref:Uncharacterized protein n=1 Tax=Adineta steineri TaxID=433720 RepID=A0A813RRS7_9BILA|nr:unnamed protein product [Adineta steineri]CAF1414231.1 unnamed protein product [Adineta steineri]
MNMASDVEDLSTFYDNLPSIFENNPSSSVKQSYNTVVADVNEEKFYQPMFGSFSFADSDPLNRAAFVVSPSPSIEVDALQERVMDDNILNDEHNISSGNETTSSLPPLADTEDIDDNNYDNDDDEDDFDGIPIRHASIMMKKKLNGDSDSTLNHFDQDHFVDEFIHRIENSQDDNDNDNDIEDDTFLNGFNDEEHEETAIVPSLFKDIPDIDDPNEPEDENDDNGRVPFDHMDMFDQSDSIRSSSPDSLLSSSHLQDEQDDDVDMDDEVAQWNDDLILQTTPSNVNLQTHRTNSPLVSNIYPFNQVDFIDSSRSNSRCSNISSHLSIGYADQARIFMSDDDELESSSDSDDNNKENMINLDCDISDRDNSEEICLQVNLDDQRSPSSFSKSNSTSSSSSTPSPVPDETPIITIDEDIDEAKTLQVAPIAVLDDEEEEDMHVDVDDDLRTCISDQPILPIFTSNIKNSIELKTDRRQNELIQDIINMRHLLNENEEDDEFIAIMHNPRIFEQVLYNNNNNNNNANTNNNDDDNEKVILLKYLFY